MRIINKVTDINYIQWIDGFVVRVLKRAGVQGDEVVVDDIEPSKRVFMFIDGNEYTIRTWNYRPVKYDRNIRPCAENVEYTLYKMVQDNDGSHGEIVDEGILKIKWNNDVLED